MQNTGTAPIGRHGLDKTLAATERMELYCIAHPGSPTAVRRPRLMMRSKLWIAILGPNVQEGIVGIGPTVEAALRAFDAQYLASLRPPRRAIRSRRTLRGPKLDAA
jgi:hypothetical protein